VEPVETAGRALAEEAGAGVFIAFQSPDLHWAPPGECPLRAGRLVEPVGCPSGSTLTLHEGSDALQVEPFLQEALDLR
jgi:hypothetical protein